MGKDELKPNLAVDPALLAQAEAAGVSTEHVAEAAIRNALRAKLSVQDLDARAKRWADENAEGIAEYNQRIAERGVASDHLRKW